MKHEVTFDIEECRIHYDQNGGAMIHLVTSSPTSMPLTKLKTNDDRLILSAPSDRRAAKNYVKNYLGVPDELITEYGYVPSNKL